MFYFVGGFRSFRIRFFFWGGFSVFVFCVVIMYFLGFVRRVIYVFLVCGLCWGFVFG